MEKNGKISVSPRERSTVCGIQPQCASAVSVDGAGGAGVGSLRLGCGDPPRTPHTAVCPIRLYVPQKSGQMLANFV